MRIGREESVVDMRLREDIITRPPPRGRQRSETLAMLRTFLAGEVRRHSAGRPNPESSPRSRGSQGSTSGLIELTVPRQSGGSRQRYRGRLGQAPKSSSGGSRTGFLVPMDPAKDVGLEVRIFRGLSAPHNNLHALASSVARDPHEVNASRDGFSGAIVPVPESSCLEVVHSPPVSCPLPNPAGAGAQAG